MGKRYNQLGTILYGIEVQINEMKQILESQYQGDILAPNLMNDLKVET